MKTLKKTLCLVLAMVMVFGLCAVSASAKLGYSDTDDITYKEAVDVMSGIGILSGDARGFRPTDKITRAEAAKIIAYIMIGNATQADALKASSDPFVDVPASHWAAGYIQYCATSGVIAGKGDGYHPNDYVKGLEFAKMLLCALGYGKQNEYIGTDWAINTSKDALRYGIFNGNLAGASTEDATREECALYAFNTIAGANDYTGIKKVSYSSLLGNYIESAWTAQNPDANKGDTFGDDFGLKYEVADDDAFGRIAGHHWTQKIGNNTRIISDDYDDDQRLIAVYTTAVTAGDIYNLIVNRFGKSFLKDVLDSTDSGSGTDGEFELYLNSAKDFADADTDVGTTLAIKPASFTKGEAKKLNYTGNGVQTYVYAWSAPDKADPDHIIDHIRICVIDTYLAKVDKVIESKGGKDPKTTVVLVESNEANIASNLEYEVKTEDFDEGDYVLVTIAANATDDGSYGQNLDTTNADDVVDIEAAPTLETEVTKYIKKGNEKSLVANGETYVTAKNTAGNDVSNVTTEDIDSAATVDNKIVDGDDHILYIDKYGYLIATSKVAEVSNYAYVAQFGKKTNDATTLNDEDILRAHVYFADGTDQILTVDTKDGIFDNDVDMVTSFPDPGDLKADHVSYGSGKEAYIGVYQVSVDKNKVTLKARYQETGAEDGISDDAVTTGGVNAVTYVTKGNANIFKDDAPTKPIANGSTVFFYVFSDYDEKDFKVTVYTGINNVPTVKRENAEKAVAKNYIENSKKILKAVYVVDALTDGQSNDVVYFFGGTTDTANFDKSKDGWTVRYYVYGGDDNGYLSIKYETTKKADEDIANHPNAGFVKVEDGKLVYVAEDQSGGTCTHTPSHKKADDVNKVTYTTEATLSLVSGDRRDTLKVTYTNKNGDQTGTTDIYMPLYKVEENGYVFDLRDEDDQNTYGGEIDSLKDLFSALINGDVDDFKAAVSIEGTETGTETNVLTGIYILGQDKV